MAVKTDGFVELQNDLLRMAAAVGSTGTNRALKAAAVPIEEQMRHNASTDPVRRSGTLYKAIHTSAVRTGKNGRKRITVGVHRKDWPGGTDYYPAYVEFGHGGPRPAKPHPYVRPAYDMRADEAYERMKDTLRNELDRR